MKDKKKKKKNYHHKNCRVHLRNYKVHLFIIIYTIYYGYLTDFSDKSFRTAQGDNPPPTPIMSSWIWLFFLLFGLMPAKNIQILKYTGNVPNYCRCVFGKIF